MKVNILTTIVSRGISLCLGCVTFLALSSCDDVEEGKVNSIGDYVEGVIFVAPDGKALNTGSMDKPLDIYTAVERVKPGETIYMRGGVYYLKEGVNLDRVATESKPVRLWAYENEKPVFDCSLQEVPDANNTGMRLRTAQWWHVKGLEIRNAVNSGFVFVDGSHNTLENCVAHHNGGSGFHMGYEHAWTGNTNGEKLAYNTFLNCDSYNNFDWWTGGTNADGFACKTRTGKGNRYIGCRAWNNSDDGWDCFECGYGVEFINCWVWSSGVMENHKEMYLERTGNELTEAVWAGDGNGFKMGGGCFYQEGRECTLRSQGTHVFRNCISFGNTFNGFDQNNHQYGAYIENCLSYDNQRNFNFFDKNLNNTTFIFRNNVSWGGEKGDRFDAITMSANEGNLWNQADLTANPAAEFTGITATEASAARSSDGSLPSKFARLKTDSKFVDKGVPTQNINLVSDGIVLSPIEYLGTAPDLGPHELK